MEIRAAVLELVDMKKAKKAAGKEKESAALEIAIEALKKQIPQDVLIMPEETDVEEEIWRMCPNCKNRVIELLAEEKYCRCCGQRIDIW